MGSRRRVLSDVEYNPECLQQRPVPNTQSVHESAPTEQYIMSQAKAILGLKGYTWDQIERGLGKVSPGDLADLIVKGISGTNVTAKLDTPDLVAPRAPVIENGSSESTETDISLSTYRTRPSTSTSEAEEGRRLLKGYGKVALLIGNANYNCYENLEGAEHSIEMIQERLKCENFGVLSLLNVTKLDLENALIDFCQHAIMEHKYVVIYFAGHGFMEQGRTFLVPTDASSPSKAEECVCENTLLVNIQEKNPKLILMILDVCKNESSDQSSSVLHLPETAPKTGNTAVLYATSVGLSAYYDSECSWLVKNLAPLLRENIGVDKLLSEVKEECQGGPNKVDRVQLPEMRSNLQEPLLSLTDEISFKGPDELYDKQTRWWKAITDPPEDETFQFQDTNTIVELKFESIFSNFLIIWASVIDQGTAQNCEAEITIANSHLRDSASILEQNGHSMCEIRIPDLQKLNDNLIIDLTLKYLSKDGKPVSKIQKVDLGRPLVSKLNLPDSVRH